MQFSWINPNKPALVLAPMEGVTDAPMRALQTERGGFSFCVSEFIRVSQEVIPVRTFKECVPELHNGGRTSSGVPVQVQILGGSEERMALSAMNAVTAGADAIDLNFGCPAPLVNKHDGGAALLRYPHRIRQIVAAVREALPKSIPVSAKLRLGWENPEDIFENAEQAALGGASWLTIHARTKVQGYRPPADWKMVGQVRKVLGLPVVANGEIWTREDFLKCQEETGCEHFMIGRSALADPSLPLVIARELGLTKIQCERLAAEDWKSILLRFSELCGPIGTGTNYKLCRIKQWLRFIPTHRLSSITRLSTQCLHEVMRAQSVSEALALLRET